jgi:tripartite-type tricarboxylate transporter receptor subunit TctC
VLVVRADAPWKTLAEFVADAKPKPGTYNYGSSGNYGTMHVPMEMLKASAGFRMTHIPYTGAGPALLALLGGQVDAVASGPRPWRSRSRPASCARWRTGANSRCSRCPMCPA